MYLGTSVLVSSVQRAVCKQSKNWKNFAKQKAASNTNKKIKYYVAVTHFKYKFNDEISDQWGRRYLNVLTI